MDNEDDQNGEIYAVSRNGLNNEGLIPIRPLAIDLVWQVSNISIINVSVFYPDLNHKWLSLAFSYLQGYV